MGNSAGTPEERRESVKKKQESAEKATILRQVKRIIDGRYVIRKEMADIGTRMSKYWMEVEQKPEDKGGSADRQVCILSVSKLQSTHPEMGKEEAEKKMATVKELINMLNKHPSIHEIKEVVVERIDKIGAHIVVVIQKRSSEGSLRDIIRSKEEGFFEKSRSEKYIPTDYSEQFQPVAKGYALQILEGMLFLKKIGFLHLGHIHLGNIFLARGEEGSQPGSDVCQLTGHENTLFGFTSPLHGQLKDTPGYLESIDVIMFGHIMYELATCQSLQTEVFPSKDQLERISDPQLKSLLKYIFDRSETKLHHSLDEVYKKIDDVKWYQRRPTRDLTKGVDESAITEDMKELLASINL